MRNIFPFLILLFSFSSRGQSNFEALRKQLMQNKTYEYVYYLENNYAEFRTFNDKMGLIDSLGNVVVKPNYKYIHNRKDLKNIFEATIIINKKYKKGFIDLQGNIKIPFDYENVYYLGNDLVRVSKNNKTGVLNIENKIIVPIKYDYIMERKGILFVRKNNSIDLFNSEGKQITSFQARDIDYFQHERSIVILKNENTLIIDTLGNMVLNTIKNHKFERIVSKDAFLILNTITKKKGIINSNGKYEIECKYDEIRPHNSIYIVKNNGKEGIIDKNDLILKPLVYDYISPDLYKDSISKNQYYAIKEDLEGIINPFIEKEVIPISYKNIRRFYNYYTITNLNGKSGVFSVKGQIIVPENYNFYNASENKIFAEKDSKKYLLTIEDNNYTEKEILADEFVKDEANFIESSKSNYQIFKDKNCFGVFSTKNQTVIPAEYDYIREVYATGEFIAKKNNKFGIINSTNQILLELKFDSFEIIKEHVRFKIKNQKAIKFYDVNFAFEHKSF